MEEIYKNHTITIFQSYTEPFLWGYEVEDKKGEPVDSNIAYSSPDDALQAAKSAVDDWIKEKIFSAYI